MQASAIGCSPLIVEPKSQRASCKQLFAYLLFGDFLRHNHVDVLLLIGRWRRGDLDALTRTIEFAHAHNIYTVGAGPNIEYDTPLPANAGYRGARRSHLVKEPPQDDAEMAQNVWHLPYISVYKDPCAPECPFYARPGVPLMFDTSHFTIEGSALCARPVRTKHELDLPQP